MKKVSLTGVLVGGVVDILTSTIFAIPLIVYVQTRFHIERGGSAVPLMFADPLLFSGQFLIGVAGSALGGYVAARIAKHDELLNGVLSSFLCTAIGAYSMLGAKSHVPMWAQLLSFVTAPVFALLGGYLRLAHKRIAPQNA